MYNSLKFKVRGFSMVELSIVIVAVGLLMGTMSAGVGLIRATKLKRIIKEVSTYKMAYNTFYTMYDVAPGSTSDPSGSNKPFMELHNSGILKVKPSKDGTIESNFRSGAMWRIEFEGRLGKNQSPVNPNADIFEFYGYNALKIGMGEDKNQGVFSGVEAISLDKKLDDRKSCSCVVGILDSDGTFLEDKAKKEKELFGEKNSKGYNLAIRMDF
ncbi:hypothetical protein FACS1894152_7790 [Bacilli bacterium]|nr:hypothetical protein FACS1894152_7790 [Bacilli bacterium]